MATRAVSKTRTYGSWRSMVYRCTNPNRPEYPRYGGRGIMVCEKWLSFDSFLLDMGVCPSKKHTIERIDNDKGYNPDNCKWATYIENLNNKSTTVKYTHNGQTMSIAQWARTKGFSRGKLWKRLHRGWSFEKAINKP